MSEFQFITISGEPKVALKNVASRRLIRTTATKVTRSKHAKETSQRHHVQSDAVREISQRGSMTKFRTKKATSTGDPLALPMSINVSVWDPIVEPLGGQAWSLLHYYRYMFRARSWAINAKRDWFAFIIGDPAATHATLSFVSLNRDLEEGTSVSQASLHHRARALHLIRQRLSSANALDDDSLFGAIALLAITEGLEGNSALSVAHVQALARLVDLRGGFKKLSKNEALTRLVAWANLCHTSSSHNYLHLPGLSGPSEMVALDTTSLQEAPSVAFQETVRDFMTPETYQIVKHLAALPTYPPTERTEASEKQSVSHLIYCMNQVLLSVKQKDDIFDSEPSTLLARVLHRSALLYIVLILRQMPRRTIVVVERARNLYDLLEDLHFDDYWHTPLESAYLLIQLWSLTIYFCALLPPTRTEKLYVRIRRLLKNLDIKTVDELEKQLCQIAWVNGFDRKGLTELFIGSDIR